jgi:uncharacterized protein YodC (DUF2158 family)
MAFKCGDVVVLKSSGPPMTVREISQNGVVTTNWFVKGKLHEGEFIPDNIKEWTPQDTGGE